MFAPKKKEMSQAPMYPQRTGVWFDTRSPLEYSRLFGPSPWKILATIYEQKDYWATQPLAKIF